MIYRYILFLIIGVDVSILLLQTSELSISYREASIFYEDPSFLQLLLKISTNLFGLNDFSLRLPMIMLHISSLVLLYLISAKYLKYESDRLWMILFFVLSPGIISSALIINSAGLIIFSLLLFIYLYEKIPNYYLYILLIFYSIIDSGFIYLFISLIFYSYYKRDKKAFIYILIPIFISLSLYGFHSHGVPKSYFLDLLGLYSAIFTPMVFVYIFYVLYRVFLTKEINMVWFIASVPLLLSLLLSFRQKIEVEIFASYLIVALPLAAKIFSSSYRVRLNIFRTKYRYFFILTFSFLLLNSLVTIFNKDLYRYIDNPKKHFAYKMNVAKELADILKTKGIDCIDSDYKTALRLKFYGIGHCDKFRLDKNILNSSAEDIVTVSYNGRVVYRATVTKINNR